MADKLESHWCPHHYNRQYYNEALFLAEYYRWLASRRFSLPGNNPITGKKRRDMDFNDNEEGVVVHKVQAKFWLNKAKQLRAYGTV
jgi:hypothetical protein